jgi:hypothetical protein
MPFMQLHMMKKGALYSCDCAKCGATLHAHEWASDDPNGRRDAMKAGTLHCDDCPGRADPDTFRESTRPQYAARLSAPGYMDATDWHYGPNARKLAAEVREQYGVEQVRDARGRFVAGA